MRNRIKKIESASVCIWAIELLAFAIFLSGVLAVFSALGFE